MTNDTTSFTRRARNISQHRIRENTNIYLTTHKVKNYSRPPKKDSAGGCGDVGVRAIGAIRGLNSRPSGWIGFIAFQAAGRNEAADRPIFSERRPCRMPPPRRSGPRRAGTVYPPRRRQHVNNPAGRLKAINPLRPPREPDEIQPRMNAHARERERGTRKQKKGTFYRAPTWRGKGNERPFDPFSASSDSHLRRRLASLSKRRQVVVYLAF